MNLNDIICYAYHNHIDFNSELNVISEILISEDETALDEDMVSIAIAHSKSDNRLVVIPKRISTDESLKRDFKKKKIDGIVESVNSANVEVIVKQRELTVETIKSVLMTELNFKDFAEISVINGNIFIQVAEKAKIDSISKYFYGYNIFFDKLNQIWFDDFDTTLPYHWSYGEKVETVFDTIPINQG